MTRPRTALTLAITTGMAGALVFLAGCPRKETRKVTVETPEKQIEVKIEKTDK